MAPEITLLRSEMAPEHLGLIARSPPTSTGPTKKGTPHLHYEQGYDADGNGTVSWGDVGTERDTAT